MLANRRNAQRSTGPRTEEGKAVVSQNAVKHGLSARRDIIRGEDFEEFEAHRAEMLHDLRPVGAMEVMLAQRIVSLSWRLGRAQRMQDAVIEAMCASYVKAHPRGTSCGGWPGPWAGRRRTSQVPRMS